MARTSDQNRWKQALLARRADLVAEGDVKIDPIREDGSTEKIDQDAQPLAEMNQVIASKRNRDRTQLLGHIDAALRRLAEDAEMFGLCSECEEPIGKRMEVMPWVTLCTACQQERDGSPRGGARRHITDYE